MPVDDVGAEEEAEGAAIVDRETVDIDLCEVASRDMPPSAGLMPVVAPTGPGIAAASGLAPAEEGSENAPEAGCIRNRPANEG